MVAAFEKKGYRSVATKPDLDALSRGKVLGLFSLRDMSMEIDRDKSSEPSVYDMTRAAIRVLHDQNPKGFFAFIESENIDSAAHLSDIASVIHDYREFDRAVGLAYEFYRKYPRETLIIVTSDHETGGLGFTLALKDLTSTKAENQLVGTGEDFKKIQSIRISLQKASQVLGRNPTGDAVDKLMNEYFRGFTHAIHRPNGASAGRHDREQYTGLLADIDAHQSAGAGRRTRRRRRALQRLLRQRRLR
jgi:alkaline phosphatase